MTEDERAEYVALRRQLLGYLEFTQQQIIDYPPKANDADFRFLLTKAAYYQRMIDNINKLLNLIPE